MKRIVSLLLALVLMMTAASALAEGKTLTWARGYESTSLDPAESADDESNNIVSYLTEGLVRVKNGAVVPGIAESWDANEAGDVFTFHLRESVWSDGTPLNAQDFVYSFFRLIDPEQGHSQSDSGFCVKNAEAYMAGQAAKEDVGYKAIDDYTIEITFASAGLENLFLMADNGLRPVKQALVEELGEAYGSDADKLLGNGPMVMDSWLHESQMVLKRNENYWNKDEVQLDQLIGMCNISGDTAVEMMMTDMIDLAAFSDPTYYQQLYDLGFEGITYTNTDQFIQINGNGKTEASGKFLSNVNFRRALSYAIDRTALVNTVMLGQTPAYRVIDPDAAGINGKFVEEYPVENQINVTADPAKAQEYLAKALEELGATAEEIPEFSMLCFDSQGNLTKLQAVQDMLLTNLGIHCAIDPQPIQQMIAKVYSSDFDFWTGGVSIGTVDAASPSGVFSYWDVNDPDALFGYDNAEYAELLDKAQQATDYKTRLDAIAAIEKIFIDEMPSLLLTWQTQNVVYRSGYTITNVDSGFGADLAFVQVAE